MSCEDWQLAGPYMMRLHNYVKSYDITNKSKLYDFFQSMKTLQQDLSAVECLEMIYSFLGIKFWTPKFNAQRGIQLAAVQNGLRVTI